MTNLSYAPRLLSGAAAGMQTRPDEEVMDARWDIEPIRRAPDAPLWTLCVLVADDCRDAADSLSMLVQLWGHDVRVAYSGRAALALAVADRPHVMLLDIAMAGMDGCELARKIRQHASIDESLLVAVTGYADEARRRLAYTAGFDHYLVKPVEPIAMEELLRVEKDRHARQHARQVRGARSRAAR